MWHTVRSCNVDTRMMECAPHSGPGRSNLRRGDVELPQTPPISGQPPANPAKPLYTLMKQFPYSHGARDYAHYLKEALSPRCASLTRAMACRLSTRQRRPEAVNV